MFILDIVMELDFFLEWVLFVQLPRKLNQMLHSGMNVTNVLYMNRGVSMLVVQVLLVVMVDGSDAIVKH